MSTNGNGIVVRCKDCKWRDEVECCTHEKISEAKFGVGVDCEDSLIYPCNEGGFFWVGPEFGCVHGEKA